MIELREVGGAAAVAGSHTFGSGDRDLYVFENVVFPTSGINRLVAADEAYGLHGRSNPSKTTVGQPRVRLYWGDTHAHSAISADSAAVSSLAPPRPEAAYDYARDVADLDFCMVTDHSQNLSPEDWRESQRAAHKP